MMIRSLLLGAILVSGFYSLGVAAGKANAPSNAVQMRLRTDVEFLANLQPARNHENVESLDRAAEYIRSELKKAGLSPRDQVYEVNGKTYRNVIAEVGPAQGDRIVIGAHYDVAGPHPGADDNGSGVAGLLEVARVLAAQKASLKRPIELVAYTLEEPPHFRLESMGSAVHARSLVAARTPVALMMSLEMIGYFTDEPGSQSYPLNIMKWVYPDRGNFIAFVGGPYPADLVLMHKVVGKFKSATDIPVAKLNAPAAIPGVDFSDHRNYWIRNIPAVMVTDTAFMRNHNYHESTDTPSTLDYARMAKVVSGVVGIALNF